MTTKEVLNEEFVDYTKNHRMKDYGVWKNPSRKELSQLVKEHNSKELRFFVDLKTKDVYVFDENLLHSAAINLIYKNGRAKRFIVKGYADKRGKINVREMELDDDFLEKTKEEKDEIFKIAKKGSLTL